MWSAWEHPQTTAKGNIGRTLKHTHKLTCGRDITDGQVGHKSVSGLTAGDVLATFNFVGMLQSSPNVACCGVCVLQSNTYSTALQAMLHIQICLHLYHLTNTLALALACFANYVYVQSLMPAPLHLAWICVTVHEAHAYTTNLPVI